MLVGDLSGKGIQAALMHGSTRVLFRALARDTRDPATLMSRLSDALYQESAGSLYVTSRDRSDREQGYRPSPDK